MTPSVRGFALSLFLALPYLLAGQCGLTVFAGNDTTICAIDLPYVIENVVVEGEGLLGVQWGPEGVFRNGETLTPSFRGNRDTTVYLTALEADPEDNLFLNPGFANRFDNWESPSLNGVGPGSPVGEHGILTEAGTYTISESPLSVHALLCSLRDHDGNGRMMVVNNSNQNNRPIVCQTVTVDPDTDYSFGAWMTNANADSPPVVLFAVNRQRITGDIELPATLCSWAPYTGTWSSGAATTAEVCIVNRNTETIGNDMAIDDLYFGPICEQVDSFRITIPVIEPVPGDAVTLPCVVPDEGVQLDGRGSSQGPEFSYLWRTPNGNIVSGERTLQPFIDQAGDYFLEVIYDDGSGVCSRERSVNVRPFPFAPTVEIEASRPGFNCLNNEEIRIDGRESSGGTPIWTAEDGGMITRNDGDRIRVSTPGKYTLTLIGGGGSGCIASQSINLFGDFEEPDIDLPAEYFVGCGTPTVVLDASGSDSGPNIQASWRVFGGGTDISGSTSYTPTVDRPGTYVLTLLDTENGCDSEATVRVRAFQFNPRITLATPQVFTCDRAQIRLNSSFNNVPFGADIVREWTTTDGVIVSGETSENPLIGRPGTYTLTLTNRANGCTASESIVVAPGAGVPVANANADRVIDCRVSSVALDASGSSMEANFTIRWEDRSGTEITTPTVSAAGTYRLIVTNTDDGCTSEDTFELTVDNTGPPTTILTNSTVLTCDVTSLELSSDQTDPNFTYTWSGPTDGITTNTNEDSVLVNAPGRYEVTTLNPGNGCSSTVSQTITADREQPIVGIEPATLLSCANPTQMLMGSIANPAGFNLRWTTAGGNFVSGETTLTPTINEAGDYTLTFENPTTGCRGGASVTVNADRTTVVAMIDGGAQLDCNNRSLTLATTGSATGPDVTYIWTRDGVEVDRFPGTGSGELTVTSAGNYELTVLNNVSGCDDATSLTVTEDFSVQPAAFDPALSYLITCNETSVTLSGAPSADPGMTYMWTRDGAPIPTNPTVPVLTTTDPGLYALTITNPVSGCTSEASQQVTENADRPVVAIATPDELNCDIVTVELLQSGGGEADVSYSWAGPGTINASADGLRAEVGQPGTYTLTAFNPLNGCTASTDVIVTQDIAAPTAEAGAGTMLTCGVTSISLDGVGSTTGANVTYVWDGPAVLTGTTTLAPEVSGAGRYFLTVTNNDNQCTAVDSVEVTADFNAPQVDLARTRVLNCVVGSVTLMPTSSLDAGWSYEWREDGAPTVVISTQPSIDVMDAGEYKLTIIDGASGCSTIAPVSVLVDRDQPGAAVGPAADLTCANMSTELDGGISTVDKPATYRWSLVGGAPIAGGASPTLTVSDPGEYQLYIEYPTTGCKDSTTVTVAVDMEAPSAALLTAGGLDCEFQSVDLLTDPASRDPDYVYTWSLVGGTLTSPSDGPTITTNQAGTYDLLVRNSSNGCEQNLSTVVAVDTVKPVLSTLTDGLLTCGPGGAMTMVSILNGRPDIAFAWSTGNGAIAGPRNEAGVAASAPGSYTVLATDPNNNCTETAEWTVTEDREIPTVTLPNAVDLGCENDPTTIAANLSDGNFSYDWVTADGLIVSGAATENVLVAEPGRYTLTATNLANNCMASASVDVTGNDLADFGFELLPANCVNPIATLSFGDVAGGEGPFLFSIDGGETFGPGGTPINLEPGEYEFQVQDARGCEAAQSVRIDSARTLEAAIDPIIIIGLGDSVVLDLQTNFSDLEIDTVIWSPAEGLSCTDCLRPTARPFRSVNYIAEIRTNDGCTEIVEVTVEVDKRLTAYFPTAFSPNNDGRNDLFHPFTDPDKVRRITNFRIHDRWGNAVFEAEEMIANDIRVGWDGTFRDRKANAGIYIYSALVEFLGGEQVVFKGEVTLMR